MTLFGRRFPVARSCMRQTLFTVFMAALKRVGICFFPAALVVLLLRFRDRRQVFLTALLIALFLLVCIIFSASRVLFVARFVIFFSALLDFFNIFRAPFALLLLFLALERTARIFQSFIPVASVNPSKDIDAFWVAHAFERSWGALLWARALWLWPWLCHRILFAAKEGAKGEGVDQSAGKASGIES